MAAGRRDVDCRSPVSPVPGSGRQNALIRLRPTTPKGQAGLPIASDRVLVAVRVRPMLGNDQVGRMTDGEGQTAREAIRGDSTLNAIQVEEKAKSPKDYTFDYVFNRSQDEIYDCIGKTMLREAFNGFNVTLFAYGQTGSGKTYTIQGLPGAGRAIDDPDDPEKEGVVPRLLKDLFDVAQDMLDEDTGLQIKVTLSFAEVYNEMVRDLLPTHKHKGETPSLEIHETPDRRIEVRGLSKHTVIGFKKVLELIGKGNGNRQVAETKMNECSSRSHSILQLHMVQQYENPSAERRDCESYINIVDLAGSERQAKTGTVGDQFQEAKHINQSLLTLGRALKSFSVGGDQKHVPLRESKLTRLLSESFGGNSKTWMLATVSPSLYNLSESNSTLVYAQAAKMITNSAKQNRLARQMELKELQELKSQLEASLDRQKQENENLKLRMERLEADNQRLRADADPAALKALKEENERLRAENGRLRSENEGLKKELSDSKDQVKQLDTNTPRTMSSRDFTPGTPPTARGASHGGLTTPQPGVYIGRAKVSLKNIIEQTSSYLSLPLSNESQVPGANKAILEVNIYPVDAKGSAALERNKAQHGDQEECSLLGQRVDFVVHIIRSRNIPKEYSGTVYCKYVYKWAEKDSYKTTDLKDTTDPEFDFKKRFAFSKMNQGLVEYFRSDNVITFEVIGMGTDTQVATDR
eukprot:Hpha_TRINITY_DN15490_c0_g4::TRINITY_DN15490_c0_g4_i1::g.176377::m.176377/K20196/KIF3B; kinesin family member 3B